MRLMLATAMATTLGLAPLLAAEEEPAERLEEAAAVLSEIMVAPDQGIPQELLEKAHCIVIVPGLKTAAFVAGGGGTGRDTCRVRGGTRQGGLVGAGHGSQREAWASRLAARRRTSFMLVMSERGADKLLESKFTLGGRSFCGRRARWAARPPRRPTRRCTPTSCRGRARRGCLPASRSRAPPCGRTSTTTPRSTARHWRTARL